MAVYVPRGQLEATLSLLATEMNAGPYQVGLYKNELTLSPDLELADIVPCDFSGYDGLRDLDAWPTSPDWVDPRAEIVHPDVTWTHNGGGTFNYIHGFYVLDSAGLLAWVDPRADGPVAIGATGQTYTVAPKYTCRSEQGV